MIFDIPTSFLLNCPAPDVSDIACDIARSDHFIQVDRDGYRIIREAVKEHGSTNQKESFRTHLEKFDIPENLRRYLRIWKVREDCPVKVLSYMINEPARLVTENASHEWPVYRHFIDVYKSDPEFGTWFKILKKAKDNGRITSEHAGGTGELLKRADDEPFFFGTENLRYFKTCVLFDRDTDDDHYYDGNKNHLFRTLAGKDHTSISENDIWTLSHHPLTWHMWYKRAIENYFPDEQYVNAGLNISALDGLTHIQRDYALIGGNKRNPPLVTDYSKSSLPDLLPGLSRQKLERHLRKFTIDGTEMSEMQLFMLKLVKIL